jgi:hypothetical protein
MLANWGDLTVVALQRSWEGFLSFFPALLAAIVVFIIGWLLAAIVGKLVAEILKRVKFNQIFNKGNWDEALAKADIKVDPSGFVGAIVKWVLVIVSLQIAVGVLGTKWMIFSNILAKVVGYLPNVIIAVLIFVVTVIITDIVEKLVRVSVERVKVGYGHIISAIVKWAIWIFAVIIILGQLNIGGSIPYIIVQGIVGFLALALGLAFGLGGKEAAAELIKEFRQKIQK